MGRDYIKYLTLAIIAVCTSCVKNDVPYPTVIPSFKTIEVRGSIDGTTVISSAKNEVTVVLSEETDIQKVTIGNVTFDPATFGSSNRKVVCSPKLEGVFNLETPLNVFLTTYQDYQWRIVATQPIKYDFTIEGQVGESVIDGVGHRVIAYVPEGTDRKSLKVLSYKLGPEKVSTPSPDLYQVSDFSRPVRVTVSAHGRAVLWEIIVSEKEGPSVKIDSLDAWTRVAWVYASGVAGRKHGFVYKKSSDSEWRAVPDAEVTVSGGSFRAALDGLEPQTGYVCRAFSGNDTTDVNSFTTGEERQLPNGGFNVYSHAESKKYYSWYDTESSLWKTKWWDSGNAGSTTVGDAAVCSPDTNDKREGKASVRLNSRFVMVKFAAGNVFSGEFAGLDGLSGGKVNFGRPWTLRPRKLCFDLKYEPGIVDNENGYPAGQPVEKGDMDRGQIYIALGDWDCGTYGGTQESPVQINTTDKKTFFDPAGPNVIAYGEHTAYASTQGWTHIEIPLDYVSTSRVPTHIIISCASSMLGYYFTGASDSKMWLDDMKLEY